MKQKRILMSLLGVLISAVGVGAFKAAALGVDPFQSFMSGMNQLIPMDFGTLYVIVNGLLLIFSLVADRRNLGIATFLNLFFFGYMADFAQSFFEGFVPGEVLIARVVCLAVGMVILCFGSALYMTAALGVSTYDAIANTLAYKWKVGPFQYCRIGCDVVCVILGGAIFLLGGGTVAKIPTIIGVGTLLTAFGMGPLIEYFNVKVARPMLKEK